MITRLWTELKASSTSVKIALMGLVIVWSITLLAVITALIFFMERPSQAQLPTPGVSAIPVIALEPLAGPLGSSVTVRGQGWTAGQMVLIYVIPPDEIGVTGYAIASAVADPQGQFTAIFVLPADSQWVDLTQVKIIARTSDGEAAAQAFFTLSSIVDQPTETPVIPTEEPDLVEPSPTPTTVVQFPTATPQPGSPLVVAADDVNIRSGPGTAYPILGLLRTQQQAEVTGLSADSGWWQIRFSGGEGERGWVSARYVTSQNTSNVPVVQAPVLPVPPTATPVVIYDWRGEYYNNPNLSGSPALVRNDASLNFDWGNNAPAAGLSADNFSARWSRDLSFPGGNYRFYVRVDDGARLWIDGNLIIDRWHDSAPTTYTADVTLSEGSHRLKLEYFERSGTALAQLAWELVETYPDWKGEYFNNPNLSGAPVLVRNDLSLGFGWGPNSPGPGVPADNFSARWTRSVYFSAGTYRFKVLVDDGARLWIDDNLIIDRWRTGDPQSFTTEGYLTEGTHRLRLEYFEYRYDAQVRLDWERADNYPDWKAEYFDNRKLQGSPVLMRNETKIEHNWGHGSPGSGVPADNFSARWTRKASFLTGTYLFQVKVDDGVRFWLDDNLVIDGWQDGSTRTFQTERQVSEGQHRLKVEYYERGGEARIEVKWQKKETPVNQQPQAAPGGPYTVDEGGTVTVDGRGSRDPDGTIVNYEWDFDYDGRTFTTDATGPTASTRYPDGPATLTIGLRVTDDKGASQIGVTRLTVQNMAPTVEAGGPYAGQVGDLITLAGTATDPGQIDQSGLSYRWEFGDGAEGNGPVVGHSYVQAGTYTVKLTVTDKDGARGSDTATVQVTAVDPPPPPPLSAVIIGPNQGVVSDTLTFDGSGSTGNIVSYAWDFGDGTSDSGPHVSHSYGSADNYTVTLTVTDSNGVNASTTLDIEITERVEPGQPEAAILKAG